MSGACICVCTQVASLIQDHSDLSQHNPLRSQRSQVSDQFFNPGRLLARSESPARAPTDYVEGKQCADLRCEASGITEPDGRRCSGSDCARASP